VKNPITTLSKNAWPEQLLEIPQPPKQLFITGTLPKRDNIKWLTVVGTRNNSKYGALVCEKLLASLAGTPTVIISGLARGIDSIALQSALSNNIPCIAVPGSGLDASALYPQSNTGLAEKIVQNNGCLLSEFEPSQKAELWTFPRRNRIMAGLSDAVLIIEATEKSGTLITARLATEYNRDVLTVPGDIFSDNTTGSHQLLRLGATPITCVEDLHEALGFSDGENFTEATKKHVEQKRLALLSDFEKELYRALFEQKTRDELFDAFPEHAHMLPATISMLLLKGVVEEVGMYLQKV
jgi:DNA processing protein